MKKVIVSMMMALVAAMVVLADVVPTKFCVWKDGNYETYDIDAATELLWQNGQLVIGGNTYEFSEVDSITFTEYAEGDTDESDTIYVTYNGTSATVTPSRSGVTASVSGANVVITNTITDKELVFELSGSSDSGYFVYNGTYKTTIRLNGLTLTGSAAEAIDIVDGKRIALELVDGTTNTLSDASEDGGQKAAFYTKGHLEISGGGTLNLTGNVKHGISSKEYMLIKKTAGTINVTAAANDGIHAGQYVQVNGGTINISGVGGDGIQAEMEEDASEDDGKVIIKGGTIDIAVTADDAAALKADSTLHIKEGTITITTTGDADKGLKSKYNVDIEGGSLTITQSGSYIVEDGDPSYTTGIKASGDINITGGSITITNTADAGKGISADGNLNISEDDDAVSINVKANGAGGELDTSKTVDSSDDSSSSDDGSYIVYVYVPSSSSDSGGMGGMGGSSSSSAWSSVYLYDSDGNKVATLTGTVTATSGNTSMTFYYYNFGEADSGTYYFGSDDYSNNSGMGGGFGGNSSTTYTIKSGTFTGPTSGSPYFYVISSSYSTSGSTRTYSITDKTSIYSSYTLSAGSASSDDIVTAAALKSDGSITIDGGTIVLTSTGDAAKSITCDSMLTVNGGDITITNSGAGIIGASDTYTAKGMTCDGDIALVGGTISIAMSGTGGKGIKGDATITIGEKTDNSGPTLTVSTTGSTLSTSSIGSSGGGMGGNFGNMESEDGGSSAKAVKAMGDLYIYGGTSTITTTQDGAEGYESKSAIYIEGGQHYLACYDDCINSSGCIYFNGGVTVAYSCGNDAVDSNASTTGAITIGDGALLAYSTIGSPEEGIDCDNNSYIRITGTGIAISAGASQDGSSSSTISNAAQGYAFVTTSINYTAARYYTLADSSGKNLVTYKLDAACSSTLGLFTATGMVSGSTYTLKYSTSAPTDATTAFHGLYIGSSATGTTSVTSFTAK